MDRTGGASKVKDRVHFYVQRERDIVPDEFKIWKREQRFKIVSITRIEIIDA